MGLYPTEEITMKWFLSVFLSAPLFSALPPLEQSCREIRAILSNRQLHQLLASGEPIQVIERQEGGYAIGTPRHTLWVEVHYLKTDGRMGPIPFELVFHEPREIR